MLLVLVKTHIRSEMGWIMFWCHIPLAAEEALEKQGFNLDS